MLVVLVHIHVKAERVDHFQAACVENARNSLLEPGVLRFDVLRQQDDPTNFTLVEVYRTPEAAVAHKQTDHYKVWAETVADMMAAPRYSVKYAGVFPEAEAS
jgi:quinol monooxygenase YgiN